MIVFGKNSGFYGVVDLTSAACFAVETIDWMVDPIVLEVWFDEEAATEEIETGRRLWFLDLIYDVDFSLASNFEIFGFDNMFVVGAIENGEVFEKMLCLSLNADDISNGLFPFCYSWYWA